MIKLAERVRLLAGGSFATALGVLLACGGSSTAAAPRAAVASAAAPSMLAASTAATGGADQPGVNPASRLESGQRLVVSIGGEDVGIKNGATIRLGEGVTAELFMDPFPPSTLSAVLDVYLQQNGHPVEDAFVSVAYDMLAMDHGSSSVTARSIGGGHFLVPLNYVMFGSWDQTLTVRAGTMRTEFRLVVIARP